MKNIFVFASFGLFIGIGAVAEQAHQVHIDFILKRPNFSCQGNKTIALGTDVLFCDQTVDGKHLQFHVTVKPDEKATFLLKGTIQEIDQDGAVSRVNELGIRAAAGESAEIQSGAVDKDRETRGNWTDWTVQADPIL